MDGHARADRWGGGQTTRTPVSSFDDAGVLVLCGDDASAIIPKSLRDRCRMKLYLGTCVYNCRISGI